MFGKYFLILFLSILREEHIKSKFPSTGKSQDAKIIAVISSAFKLSSIIAINTKKRCALTPEDQKRFLDFVQQDPRYYKHYDTFVFMIETGLRIGELTGLTLKDIDWKNNRIIINHQLQVQAGRKSLYIETTKTEDGVRNIPLTPRHLERTLLL